MADLVCLISLPAMQVACTNLKEKVMTSYPPYSYPCFFNKSIGAFADNELQGEEKKKMEAHLKECAECSSRLALLQGMDKMHDKLLAEKPEATKGVLREEDKDLQEFLAAKSEVAQKTLMPEDKDLQEFLAERPGYTKKALGDFNKSKKPKRKKK